MLTDLSFQVLLDYTEWEREKWHDWLRSRGDAVMQTSAGPHGDGRFQRVGDLVKHVFSAEKRYVERLSDRPLTDPAAIPDDLEGLFQFGRQSRKELKELLAVFPDDAWNVPNEYKILNNVIRVTPKKIVIHVLVHEIRHWAQIATVLRLNGLPGEFHDFLFSPVLAGESGREQRA